MIKRETGPKVSLSGEDHLIYCVMFSQKRIRIVVTCARVALLARGSIVALMPVLSAHAIAPVAQAPMAAASV